MTSQKIMQPQAEICDLCLHCRPCFTKSCEEKDLFHHRGAVVAEESRRILGKSVSHAESRIDFERGCIRLKHCKCEIDQHRVPREARSAGYCISKFSARARAA